MKNIDNANPSDSKIIEHANPIRHAIHRNMRNHRTCKLGENLNPIVHAKSIGNAHSIGHAKIRGHGISDKIKII